MPRNKMRRSLRLRVFENVPCLKKVITGPTVNYKRRKVILNAKKQIKKGN